MREMKIPFVIGALGVVPKIMERGPEKLEIGRRSDTIEIWSVRILKRVQGNWGDFRSFRIHWMTTGLRLWEKHAIGFRCLTIHGIHVTTDNSTYNNGIFLFQIQNNTISQRWILDHNSLDTRGNYFASLLNSRQNKSKLSQNRCNSLIW